jgi:transposase, IS5 family
MELSQVVLFGLVLPEPERLMEPWLREVDKALGDEEIVEAVMTVMRRRWQQSARRGRAGTPAEVVLRMLVLKHLRHWSYDELEREVTGSLVYRRFCRIDAGKVPDAKTMVRWGQVFDGATWGQVFDGATLRRLLHRLVTVAASAGVTKGKKMRVHHSTDSGLCEDVIRVLSRAMRRLAQAGVELGFKVRNVRRSVSRRMREIAQGLRRRGERAKRAIRKPYRRLLRITGRLVRQAERAAQQAQLRLRTMRGRRRLRVKKLAATIAAATKHGRQVMRQTRARVLGAQTRTPGKIVSIFEPWAQIIRKGKLDRPTEFGVVVKVQEAEGGIVTDIAVDEARADSLLLVPAVEHHQSLFGRVPRTVATDRGFYSGRGEQRLSDMGVRHPVLPRPGHRTRERVTYERQRWFKRGRAWRAGGEARISRLKNTFGMQRSPYRGRTGVDRCIGWAAIANNLVAIGRYRAADPSP